MNITIELNNFDYNEIHFDKNRYRKYGTNTDYSRYFYSYFYFHKIDISIHFNFTLTNKRFTSNKEKNNIEEFFSYYN
jgi:hypothetical protein